jgi:hypothetical protein
MEHNEPRTSDGAFGPPLFLKDFAIGHIAWVTSQFAASSALLFHTFNDQVYCRFAFWIPVLLPYF